jgi:undecaprenyl pyrophosphate phosphatase UppP
MILKTNKKYPKKLKTILGYIVAAILVCFFCIFIFPDRKITFTSIALIGCLSIFYWWIVNYKKQGNGRRSHTQPDCSSNFMDSLSEYMTYKIAILIGFIPVIMCTVILCGSVGKRLSGERGEIVGSLVGIIAGIILGFMAVHWLIKKIRNKDV